MAPVNALRNGEKDEKTTRKKNTFKHSFPLQGPLWPSKLNDKERREPIFKGEIRHKHKRKTKRDN